MDLTWVFFICFTQTSQRHVNLFPKKHAVRCLLKCWKVPSGTLPWKIHSVCRKNILKGSMFHCYGSLPVWIWAIYFDIFDKCSQAWNYLRKHLAETSMTLRIQVCPKKGIISTILFWGWDLHHQSYSREGSGFLGWYIGKDSILVKQRGIYFWWGFPQKKTYCQRYWVVQVTSTCNPKAPYLEI